jgi:hypothetical protein
VRRPRRWLLFGLVLAVVAAGAAVGLNALLSTVVPQSPTCTLGSGPNAAEFDPEQAADAATITAVAKRRGLANHAVTIALAAAMQESKLFNVDYGDRDSVGIFQQRPSQGWGTEAQILDPIHATNAFLDALVKFEGYETADITKIAQRVQKSGFPEAYRDHEGQGRVLASTLTGHSPAGLTCRLDAVKSSVSPQRVASDLAQQMGVTSARPSTGHLTVTAQDTTTAWAVAQWAVARAEIYGATKVSIGDRAWLRSAGDEGWSQGAAGTTVTISLG